MTNHAARARFLLQFRAPSRPRPNIAHHRLSDFWWRFYSSMAWWALALQHTHYMVPFAPSALSLPVKQLLWPLLGVIPDVTCIMLAHTTKTADNNTTTPILDSTLSPRPPSVDHRGDYFPSHIQHRLGYLPAALLPHSTSTRIFACAYDL